MGACLSSGSSCSRSLNRFFNVIRDFVVGASSVAGKRTPPLPGAKRLGISIQCTREPFNPASDTQSISVLPTTSLFPQASSWKADVGVPLECYGASPAFQVLYLLRKSLLVALVVLPAPHPTSRSGVPSGLPV